MKPQQCSEMQTSVDVSQKSSIVSAFDQKDEAFRFPDTQKGCYKWVQAPSYNSPNPVNSNSYTTICISEGANYITDIKSSYFICECFFTFDLSKPIIQQHWQESNKTNSGQYERIGYDQVVFVGWKSSIEAVQRYDLVINGQSVYSQNFVGEESFCWNQTLSDSVLNNSPYVYTSYDNASKMDPRVCGTYLLFKSQTFDDEGDGQTHQIKKFTCRFPIKIPIDNFYILRELDTIHSWMGKWEIRLYFSPNNLVWLPIKPEVVDKWFNSYVNNMPIEMLPPTLGSHVWHQFEVDRSEIHAGLAHEKIKRCKLIPYSGFGKDMFIQDWMGIPECWGWLDKNVAEDDNVRWKGSSQFVQMHDKLKLAVYFGNDENGKRHHLCYQQCEFFADSKNDALWKNKGKSYNDVPYTILPDNKGPIFQNLTISLVKMECYQCEVVLCQDMIISEVNNALKIRYLGDRPYTIMVSIIYVSRFTGMPTMGDMVIKNQPKNFMMVLCQSVNNVSCMMILPARSHNQHTVFFQPNVISYQLQLGEYGTYPVEPFNSFHNFNEQLNGIKCLHYVQDSLNFTRNKLLAMPMHLAFQYCPNTFIQRTQYDENSGIIKHQNMLELHGAPSFNGKVMNQDLSNYVFYLPFSHPEVFQNGLSSPVNVLNIKFSGKFMPITKNRKFRTPWMIAFVVHGILMIRPNMGGDNASVIFSDRTLMSNS
ncbi:MAG: hypothetical protein LBR15_00605 [Methanobrevibacter sp.]|nr:hypothetical protein [Candidatus Methanovirga australis]